jgi:dephospho-CoA kinase
MNRPYRIGLTGNIACGKSTVLQELQRLGAAVLDADAVAHQVMRKGTTVHAAIAAAFGPGILAPDGEIDRRALGAIVFGDPAALSRLEAIVHPAVVAATERWLAEVTAEVAVIDAIKLIEAGIADRCDEVWVVTCPPEEQARRLQAYRGLSEEEAWTRIRAQPPQEEKVARADVVIDNGGHASRTRTQVRAAWRRTQSQAFSGERGSCSDAKG